jgi:hypothetical protein
MAWIAEGGELGEALPPAVIEHLIERLDLTSIGRCACVSRTWRSAADRLRSQSDPYVPIVLSGFSDSADALADALKRRSHCHVNTIDVSGCCALSPSNLISTLASSPTSIGTVIAHCIMYTFSPDELDFAKLCLDKVPNAPHSLFIDVEVHEQLRPGWQPPDAVIGNVRELQLGRFASGESIQSLAAPSLNVSDGNASWANIAASCAREAVAKDRPARLAAGGSSGNVHAFDDAASRVGALSLELSMDPSAPAHALSAVDRGVLTLRLVGTAIGDDDARELAKRMELLYERSGECVRELDLQGSAMTWKGATRIAEALGAYSARYCCGVEAIDLGQGMAGDSTAEALASACRQPRSRLKRVSMPRGHLGDLGCRRLASAAEEGFITRLCLARNRITRVAVKAVARALLRLESLDLSEVGLEDEDAFIIAEELKTAQRLRWLRIAGNKVGDEGAASLSNGVKAHAKRACTMQLLNMERNALQPGGGRGRKMLDKACEAAGVEWRSSGSEHELKRHGGLQAEERFGETTSAELVECESLMIPEKKRKLSVQQARTR